MKIQKKCGCETRRCLFLLSSFTLEVGLSNITIRSRSLLLLGLKIVFRVKLIVVLYNLKGCIAIRELNAFLGLK